MKENPKLSSLRQNLIALEVGLNSILSSLEKYQDTANIMIQLEEVNKTRRYGRREYIHRYVQNPNKNISSHMRLFLYNKAMEEKLVQMAQSFKKNIYELQIEIYRLEQEEKP